MREKKTDVETVTIDVQEYQNLQDLLVQTGQENVQLLSDIKKRIDFKDNMVEKLQKAEGDNKDLRNYINDMSTVINTSPAIEDLKRRMEL